MTVRRAVRVREQAGALGALLVASCAAALAACGGDGAADAGVDGFAPGRVGRFGSLRDLVAVERTDDLPGTTLLVDRFEVTQGDWAQFAATAAGAAVGAERVTLRGNPALPASGMTLREAAAFARWRLGRLPTVDEWRVVTVGDTRGGVGFPWGLRQDPTRANTADLALGEAMPVGTFESGRKAGGNAPYDLIGNVREWTVSVPQEWCVRGGIAERGSFARSHALAQAAPALAVWAPARGVLPAGMLVGVGGAAVPRHVVGADFETPMRDVFEQRYDEQGADERRQRTGLRVYTTVGELLGRLFALPGRPSDEERAQLGRFVARDRHRRLLLDALRASPLADVPPPPGSFAALVVELLAVDEAPR